MAGVVLVRPRRPALRLIILGRKDEFLWRAYEICRRGGGEANGPRKEKRRAKQAEPITWTTRPSRYGWRKACSAPKPAVTERPVPCSQSLPRRHTHLKTYVAG